MSKFLSLVVALLAVSGCTPLERPVPDPVAPPRLHQWEEGAPSDVRVFCYVKPRLLDDLGYSDPYSEGRPRQRLLRRVLIHENHSLYGNLREKDFRSDEALLSTDDMQLLLVALEHRRFFDSDFSMELGTVDPFAYADARPEVLAILAVEILTANGGCCLAVTRLRPGGTPTGEFLMPKRTGRVVDCERLVGWAMVQSWARARVSFDRPFDFSRHRREEATPSEK